MDPTDQIQQRLKERSWSWLLKNLILPLGDLAYGQRMMHRLRYLEAAQWWETGRLLEQRDRELSSLLKIVYNEVPFYRNLFDTAGVCASDIKCAADLSKLPIVTKDMLRPGYPQLTTRRTGFKTFDACSSGSTGANFCVKNDSETAGHYRASLLLAFGWAGWQIGDPHIQTGITPERMRGRGIKDLLLRCHYVSAFDLADETLDQSLELLDKHRAKFLFGYPGSLYCLAQRAKVKGWNRPLRSVVTWGDNLYPHYRQTIEAAFKTHIFDTYGCGEGMQIAAQCGGGSTYHIHTLDVIVECLDDAGQPAPPGQPGNLILTRLHPGPMPLLRYQVGDVGVLGRGRVCECGRGYEVMEGIQGRDTDIVITPSGNRLIVHFFTGTLEHFPEIEAFQVVQESLESMTVRIVPGKSYQPETGAQIRNKLIEKGATAIKIEIELVDNIPTAPSGKRRFVISRVSKPFVDSTS